MKRVLFALIALCAALSGVTAPAQPALVGLSLPKVGMPPYPAVILLHGCSGILENEAMWQGFFAELGYASTSVDSLTPRHVSEICTDFTRVRMPERVRDAYSALVQMAARSDIDAKRIALMGFSNGGVATLASLTTIVQAQLVPGSPRFRAGLAFYPDCSLYKGPFSVPIMTAVGELDDWTPAKDCDALAASLAAAKQPFISKVIPGAHHSFDLVMRSFNYNGQVRNFHKPGGYGASTAGSIPATEAAKKLVGEFLARELAPAK